MTPINRIVVTGDILRQRTTGGSSQTGNILWLYHQVLPAINLVCELPVSVLVHSGTARCLGTKLFQANRMKPSFDAWVRLFDKQPAPRDLGLIWDELDGALVVSFELPDILRLGLDQLAIPYVDFTIHPVRFLDDLLLGARSNTPGLGEALREHVVREEEIRIGAGLARATLAKIGRPVDCEDADDIALFAGQTNDDKVLIRNGRFAKPDDFNAALAKLCSAHERVLVKPHPYAARNPIVTALTRLFPNTRVVTDNFYHLLAQANVSTAYSLTSGTGIEAGYFGKEGVHLAPYPYTFSHNSTDAGRYLTLHPDLHLPTFWSAALRPFDAPLTQVPALRLGFYRSRMRHSLRSFWGAGVFEEAA